MKSDKENCREDKLEKEICEDDLKNKEVNSDRKRDKKHKKKTLNKFKNNNQTKYKLKQLQNTEGISTFLRKRTIKVNNLIEKKSENKLYDNDILERYITNPRVNIKENMNNFSMIINQPHTKVGPNMEHHQYVMFGIIIG